MVVQKTLVTAPFVGGIKNRRIEVSGIECQICSGCKAARPLSEFGRNKSRPGGYSYRCKPCARVSVNAHYRKHSSKSARRRSILKKRFGITPEQYNQMVIEQTGRCAICKTMDPGHGYAHFPIDHDHATGKVRGLLCGLCNRGLGFFRDDIEALYAAIEYLRKSRKES